MSEFAAAPNSKVSPVRSTIAITFDDLVSSLEEYTNQLNTFINEFQRRQRYSEGVPNLLQDIPYEELSDAIGYFKDRLAKLIDISSANREYLITDEGQRFKIDLRMFQAELALKRAERFRNK